MDPRAPSLEFVRDREKTQQFFRELTDAGLSKQTQLNYMKNLKRFLTYQTINTNLRHDDKDLHTDCREFIDYLGLLQKSCSKKVSKEITQKRHERLTADGELTTHDCTAVLRAAKGDFLAITRKMLSEKQLTTDECLDYMYNLQALVILKHLQRPGVVTHMTVPEWLNKKTTTSGYTVVGVKEHKTSAQQVATFALSQEEVTWFDLYYTCVRPQLQSCIRKRKREDMDGTEERFFISSASGRIHNPSNDLQRLHIRYGVRPWVTSQRARRVFETATKSLTDTEKSLVADYLTHSTATAEKHYRMKQADNVVRASQLLDLLAGQSTTDPSEGESSRAARSIARNAAQQKAETTDLQTDFEAAYNRLVEQHPVTVEGGAPDKALRADISPSFQRKLYERWVKAQMKLRKQHIHSRFGPRLPSEEKVSKWISDQGWRSNIPSAAQFVNEWKPHGSVDTALDAKRIRRLTRTQRWKGLVVTEDGGEGKGVIATRRFLAGEVVCDYHGQVVTASEGHSTHSTVSAEDGVHMFFFENMNGQAMCIDAHSPCCECHPDRQTFGRLIKHSRKCCNLRPRAYTLQNGVDIIIFLATKNIKENEELLFDYGVERRSLIGKGLNLLWV
ncbi:uncharacterized protein LOC128604579 [Ictalurus furcatus]|uniref:uncharacterized protein LOC128604579 n=1 Tax=Ictalurus furcatus TaxID=66913 RepID=UPI00235103A9|nr:uncharacterized protein LOC128604579 [Ictalurus furcatus]